MYPCDVLYHEKIGGIKVTERKVTPQERYDQTNTTQIKLKLNLKADSDILEKLESVPNKSGYLKKLIHDDIIK